MLTYSVTFVRRVLESTTVYVHAADPDAAEAEATRLLSSTEADVQWHAVDGSQSQSTAYVSDITAQGERGDA